MTTMITRLILVAVLLAALPVTADAQYFGRNKIQYEEFDWYVLKTDRFDIHAYEAQDDSLITDVARMAERWYARLGGVFTHEFNDRKPLIFYANQPDFQQTNTTPSTLSQATGGFTESLKDRVSEVTWFIPLRASFAGFLLNAFFFTTI